MDIHLLAGIFLVLVFTSGYFTTHWSEGNSFLFVWIVRLIYLIASLFSIYYLVIYLQGV